MAMDDTDHEEIDDIAEEIEKLKLKKLELTNRMNMAVSFDDKEDIRQEIVRITAQIEILDKFKK
jgi:hypothetical protein